MSEWTKTGRRPGSVSKYKNRHAPIAGIVFALAAGLQTIVRVSGSYAESIPRGNRALLSVVFILGIAAGLLALIAFAQWIPSFPQSLALRRKIPKTTLVLLTRATPGYWEALRQIDTSGTMGQRINLATVTIDDDGLTVWKGGWHPYPVVQVKLNEIVSADYEIATTAGLRFKVIVVTVQHGETITEIPFALFTILGGLGVRAIGRNKRAIVLTQLRSSILGRSASQLSEP